MGIKMENEEIKLNKYGMPIFTSPDMNEENVKFIEKYLSKEKNMLEFGSGGSTIHFSRYVKHIISVEHDPYWSHQVQKYLNLEKIKNASLIHVKPNAQFELGSTPKTQRQIEFYDYIRVPDFIKENIPDFSFDIVFIDGRARVECAKYIFPLLHKDSIVIMHDYFGRHRYHSVLEWYDEIDSIKTGNTAQVLVRKKDILERYFPNLIK
jgi:predicted O-methyltransferase YrrM